MVVYTIAIIFIMIFFAIWMGMKKSAKEDDITRTVNGSSLLMA